MLSVFVTPSTSVTSPSIIWRSVIDAFDGSYFDAPHFTSNSTSCPLDNSAVTFAGTPEI